MPGSMPACDGVRRGAFRAAHVERVPLGMRMLFRIMDVIPHAFFPYVDMPPLLITTFFILFLSICVGLFRIPHMMHTEYVCIDS